MEDEAKATPQSEQETPAKQNIEDLAPVVSDSSDSEEQGSRLPFPIVGIGASAGGLEAFTDLLRTTPANTGMSFVIISHLPSHHRSLLPEILGRNTKMPVNEIRMACGRNPTMST